MLRAYQRYGASLQAMLSASKAALGLRVAALDSLMVLAALEARHAKPGRVHVDALDAARGAYRRALDGLVGARRPPPEELLARMAETHLVQLLSLIHI